ncbi:hypothetical protein AB0E10_40815 [Streptomyces sp. NPDC048045]
MRCVQIGDGECLVEHIGEAAVAPFCSHRDRGVRLNLSPAQP